MEDKRITLNNIDDIRDEIDGSWESAVEDSILCFIECSYENELENGKITTDDLKKMATIIIEKSDFNDYIDSYIQDEMREYLEKNNIIKDEEELEQ